MTVGKFKILYRVSHEILQLVNINLLQGVPGSMTVGEFKILYRVSHEIMTVGEFKILYRVSHEI